jgi:hypothetical protein
MEVTAKTFMINNIQTVRLSHQIDHSMLLVLNLQNIQPTAPSGGDVCTSLPMSDTVNYRLA